MIWNLCALIWLSHVCYDLSSFEFDWCLQPVNQFYYLVIWVLYANLQWWNSAVILNPVRLCIDACYHACRVCAPVLLIAVCDLCLWAQCVTTEFSAWFCVSYNCWLSLFTSSSKCNRVLRFLSHRLRWLDRQSLLKWPARKQFIHSFKRLTSLLLDLIDNLRKSSQL